MSDYRLFNFRQEEKNGRGESGALRMIAYALLDVADAIREHAAVSADVHGDRTALDASETP